MESIPQETEVVKILKPYQYVLNKNIIIFKNKEDEVKIKNIFVQIEHSVIRIKEYGKRLTEIKTDLLVKNM